MIKNYEDLANAIVALAFKDYVRILKKIKARPFDKDLQFEKEQLEKFFLGEKITVYTNIEGTYLLQLAKRKADE